MSKLLLFVPFAAVFYLEEAGLIKEKLPQLYGASGIDGLSKTFGLVILVNIILSGLFLVVLGAKVGKARGTYRDKAIKDGEKDAEARYSYPNLYVDGNTKNSKLFNCVQRGHQQALETYTQFITFSIVSGLRFPVATAFTGLMWIFCRAKWAEGYATGEPSRRYDHFLAFGIWVTLIFLLLGAIGTVAKVFLLF
jgi:glutathione S-transferase